MAVSGGPDSLALLLLTAAWKPGLAEAATVDHGLRSDSAREAQFVAGICGALDVPHRTIQVRVGEGNLQSEARAARYAALGQWAKERRLGAVATAHHADDQAETLLMRLNRSSGLRGLAGIRAASRLPGASTLLLRPLLGWRKSELAALVAKAGVEAVDDTSNRDSRFDRSRIRAALAQASWLDPAAIARSAAHLADAEAALEWAVDREWRDCVRVNDGLIAYRPGDAPRAIRIVVVERGIVAASGRKPRGAEIARLEEQLSAGGKATLGGVVAQSKEGVWIFRAEPPRSC